MRSNQETPETKARVLIVEDERPLILLVRRTLLKQGYEVVGEVTVGSGLRRLGEESFDLVLVDYRLPDKSGVELIAEMAARQIQIPVIMLTGYTDVKLAVEVMKAGAADYVIKDARLEFIRSLPKKVAEVLERHALERRSSELSHELEVGREALKNTRAEAEDQRRELAARLEQARRPLADLLDCAEAGETPSAGLCRQVRTAFAALGEALSPALD